VTFDVDASAVIDDYSSYSAANVFISINQNYTLEFWFKSADGDKGVLWSMHEENPNWDGLVIELNSKNHAHSPGNIQVSENMNNHISSVDINPTTGERNNWNDDQWHLIHVRRSGNYLQLWIDGEKDTEALFSKRSNGRPSQVHLMGAGPGKRNINGEMSEIAFYQYALQGIQINHRWLFTTRYRVSGYTLLQGTPIEATVRFYEPATDRYLDVVSFIPDNKTTKYRIHGPVKPAEFDDSHLIT
jgi:hypothetical protein